MATTHKKAEEVREHIRKSRPNARIVGVKQIDFGGHYCVHVKRSCGTCDSNLYIWTKSRWDKLGESTKNLTEVG